MSIYFQIIEVQVLLEGNTTVIIYGSRNTGENNLMVAYYPVFSGIFDIWSDLLINIFAGAVIVQGHNGNARVSFNPWRHCLRNQSRAAKGRVGLNKKGDAGEMLYQRRNFN